MSVPGLTAFLDFLSRSLAVSGFEVRALVAVLAVSLTCGLVGALVVGNRMAFFSDAMAHTAFAGFALGLLAIVVLAGARSMAAAEEYMGIVPVVMVALGSAVGVAVAAVRERTGLSNDTVIGVFFALSIGFGAMFLPALRQRVNVDPEQFLFGSLLFVSDTHLAALIGMLAVTVGIVAWRYNALVFASFNPALARSRGLPVRFDGYLFIVLLAVVVNLSILAIGALLINALLVVPAAAAANVARNLRQMFWLTLAGSVGAGAIGYELSRRLTFDVGGRPLEFGPAGTIVVVAVGWFFLTMVATAIRRREGRANAG